MTISDRVGLFARGCARRADASAFSFQRFSRVLFTLLCALGTLCFWHNARALGTPAGTTIDNVAQVTFVQGGTPGTATSNITSFRVDEIINVRVTAPAAPTTVTSPETNRPILFLLTNTGNGPESFNLSVNLNPAVPDQFNPLPGTAGQLFIDTNGNGTLEPGTDTLISGPVTLNPDQTLRVLVVSDIPAGRANGDQGVVTLTAASATPGAAGTPVGAILAGAGTPVGGGAPVDAVIGVGAAGRPDSGADDTANGTYAVNTVAVTLVKTVIAVTSPTGVTTTGCNNASPPPACAVIIPGSILTYRITLTVSGSGTAQAVQFSDAIPANTTWVAGSIRIDGAARTDVADGDNASCVGCGNATGAVTANFGNVTVVPATPEIHTIDYQVRIN